MGKKRRREDSEERIRRKLKKYSDKLEGKLKNRRRIIYSSDEDSDICLDTFKGDASTPEPLSMDVVVDELPADRRRNQDAEQESVPEPRPPSSTPPAEVAALDEDTLELLGAAPEPDMTLGKPIHKDVADRWLDIIKKGLTREIKDKLAKEYPIPSNCDSLVPPILNAEVKVALTEPLVKRDNSLVYRQKQIGNALAALAPAVDVIISKECDPNVRKKLLKPVSDACKIMCDMYHNETRIRKKFVISTVSSSLKDTLTDSSTDTYLFGDNMTEKIKTAKNIQRSGEALKVPPKVQKPGFTRPFNRSNFKPLQQKTAGRQDAGKTQPATRQQSGRAGPAPRRGRAAPRARRSPPPSPPRRRYP